MLQQRAMLVNLVIHAWTARKQDKKVSHEVEANHGAKDAGNFNKLLIDKSALQPLSQHSGRMREYHYRMTLPWGDNGDRLLPSSTYFEYTTAMRDYKQTQTALADKFAQEYASLVANARVKLGSMYNAADYPHADEIRQRFSVETSFTPVPDANDFRVDVEAEIAEEIRQNIMKQVGKREQEAAKECWERLYQVVSKIEVVMAKENPIFRDSLITNAQEVVALLPKLNITDDAQLTQICTQINTDLLIDPARLRNSRVARELVLRSANTFLQEINKRRGT